MAPPATVQTCPLPSTICVAEGIVVPLAEGLLVVLTRLAEGALVALDAVDGGALPELVVPEPAGTAPPGLDPELTLAELEIPPPPGLAPELTLAELVAAPPLELPPAVLPALLTGSPGKVLTIGELSPAFTAVAIGPEIADDATALVLPASSVAPPPHAASARHVTASTAWTHG
jgi:hypothetical protein